MGSVYPSSSVVYIFTTTQFYGVALKSNYSAIFNVEGATSEFLNRTISGKYTSNYQSLGRFFFAGDGMRWYGGAFYPSTDSKYDMSHNTFVDIFRSSGIFPLLAYILFLVQPFFHRLRSLRRFVSTSVFNIEVSSTQTSGLTLLVIMSLVSSSILAKPLSIFFLIIFAIDLKCFPPFTRLT